MASGHSSHIRNKSTSGSTTGTAASPITEPVAPGMKHIKDMRAWAAFTPSLLRYPKKLLIILWLGVLHGVVIITSKLERISKDLYVKASQTSASIENKIKNWDKVSIRLIKSAGQIVTKIDPKDIKPYTEEVRISPDIEVLCTYEWKYTPLEDHTPTIYVPGFSRRFKKPELPCKVNQDTGKGWKDQHISRVVDFQFEPLQALTVMNPDVRFHDVDVVVRRTTLLLLL